MNKMLKVIESITISVIIFLLTLGTFTLNWAKRHYGNIGFSEIVFTLNMPLKGASDELVYGYVGQALIQTILISIFLIFMANYHFKKIYSLEFTVWKKRKTVRIWPIKVKRPKLTESIILCLWLAILLWGANQSFALFEFLKGQIMQSPFIEEEYIHPDTVKITFPEEKRNLILIWVESLESTLQDEENGGIFGVNYIPELTEYAKAGVSFSQNELMKGAAVAPDCGWTIAGVVAQTAGLPLKLFEREQDTDSSMSAYASFLPGAVSLGEILQREGYRNYYIQGCNKKFGGKGDFLEQHGGYEIFDHITARELGKIPQDYSVWWGYEDVKLFEYAKEYLLEVAEKGEPFQFSMMTADTHHPNGYVCELCRTEYEEQYANVYRCASRQVSDFVEWIKVQEFYENTTIVIIGDHCSMNEGFFMETEYDKYTGSVDRAVYNAIINSPIEPINEKNREFTTLDFFPTILASLGVEIEGEKLGLGTNLFSEEKTLAEEFGYEYLFAELNKKSRYYDEELLYPKKN